MGQDMVWREADLERRKGRAIAGRAYVVVVIEDVTDGEVKVEGPLTKSEARKRAKALSSARLLTYVRKMRGPLVDLIEDNQP